MSGNRFWIAVSVIAVLAMAGLSQVHSQDDAQNGGQDDAQNGVKDGAQDGEQDGAQNDVKDDAQDDAQNDGQDGARGDRRRQFDPEEFRQRRQEMIKERLGVNDEEWMVLEPKLEKVDTLSRQAMAGRFGGRGFGRGGPWGSGGPGGPGGPGGQTDDADLPDTVKKMQALNDLLEDDTASNDQIKQALTDLREARDKARKDLDAARDELKQVLTVKQEAQMVAMGILE